MLLLTTLGTGCALRGHSEATDPGDGPAAASTADAQPAGTDMSTDAASGAKDQDKDKIFFAPVALGPLATINPAARTAFTSDLAARLVWKDAQVDGLAPTNLPDSDAQEWKDGSVPAASDASLVVLTMVLALDAKSTPDTVQATVEMKALDPSGATIFDKKAIGHAPAAGDQGIASAKPPESAAAWDACTTLVGALATVIEGRAAPAAAPGAVTKLVVEINSDPPKAAITIDGAAAGTTPSKTMLSTSPHTVAIALDGYDTWTKSDVVPSDGMIIQPILHKTGSTDAQGATAVTDTSTDETATSTSAATPAGPQPKRAEVDPIAAPPTPDTLVVPGDK